MVPHPRMAPALLRRSSIDAVISAAVLQSSLLNRAETIVLASAWHPELKGCQSQGAAALPIHYEDSDKL
jgi:hypothetical protein